MTKEEDNKIDTFELIAALYEILQDKKQRKNFSAPLPVWRIEDAAFLMELLLTKSEGSVVVALVDEISRCFLAQRETFFRGPALRRTIFLVNYLLRQNAAHAARAAGYSPKSAKQQGYRTLRRMEMLYAGRRLR